MNYEKELPDYAMIPAREMEEHIITPITKGAIYSSVEVTNVSEKTYTIITLEEDLLVPDTKPDLAEILTINGKAHLACREINYPGKGSDYITVSGELCLTTLYLPEKNREKEALIAIDAKVPFKEQWQVDLNPESVLIAECKVIKIEYMVINERKYRVKASIKVWGKEYLNSSAEIFEGVSGEDLQVLKETALLTDTVLRKKDILSIKEDIILKEGVYGDTILSQNIKAVENYKQVTGEKAIVNGFIYVNLLISAEEESEEEHGENLRQLQERLEFTHFIPLGKVESISGSNVCFDEEGLRVKLTSNESGQKVFRVEGDIVTYIEVYSDIEKDVIVDAYHRKKDFICDFKEKTGRRLVGASIGETTVREIISPEGMTDEPEKTIYTSADVLNCQSYGEPGKTITEGTILARIIFRCVGEDKRLFCIKEEVPFRIVTAVPQMTGNEEVGARVCIKDAWAEKINGKQLEFNAGILVSCEIMRPTTFKVLANPAFEEYGNQKAPASMVVYVAGSDDNLWSTAKKFKTTTEKIVEVNKLEEDILREGQKLLIIS